MRGLNIERFLNLGKRGEGEMKENCADEKAGQGAIWVVLVSCSYFGIVLIIPTEDFI